MPIVTYSADAWARLGKRIRAERERAGLSRHELAELAGVSPGSVQSAENGKKPASRWPQSLSAIERGLGWAPESVQAILAGDEPTPLPKRQQEFLSPFPSVTAGAQPTEASPPASEGGDGGADIVGQSDDGRQWWFAEVKRLQERAAGAGMLRHSTELLAEKLYGLSPQFLVGMNYVLDFGLKSVEEGAPPWLARDYEVAVIELLTSLIEDPEPDLHERKHSAMLLRSHSPIGPWRSAFREATWRTGVEAERARSRAQHVALLTDLEAGRHDLPEFEVQNEINYVKRRIAELSEAEATAARTSAEVYEPIEAMLQRALAGSGKSIDVISRETHLPGSILEAMINGKFSVLESSRIGPSSEPMVIEWLRELARAVGLAEDDIVERYKEQRVHWLARRTGEKAGMRYRRKRTKEEEAELRRIGRRLARGDE